MYAMGMAEDRRKNPRDDIVTKLINADVDGKALGEDEFGYFVIMLAVAGNETTRNAITHGMNAFFDHPDQWELYKKERPKTATDEIIRWATPVTVFQRTALNDVMVGEQLVKKGERVGIFYASANHDEASSRTRTTSTSCATPTRTSPSAATARTTASAPTWRGSRSRSCST